MTAYSKKSTNKDDLELLVAILSKKSTG